MWNSCPRTLIAVFLALGACIPVTSICADSIATASSSEGRIEIFVAATAPNGALFHSFQRNAAGTPADLGAWKAWTGYAPQPDGADQIVAATDAAGRVMVAWLSGGSIWFMRQNEPNQGMQPPAKIDTHDLKTLAVAMNSDGRIELFSISSTGAAWSTYQTEFGKWTWANKLIGGHDLRALAPTRFAHDGRIALVALGADGKVYLTTQTSAGAGWGPWTGLEGENIVAIAAGANADGRLNVAVIGNDGAFYERSTDVGAAGPPGYEGWSQWRFRSAGPYSAPLKLARNADGRLEAFMRKREVKSDLVHIWQTTQNGSWGDSAPTLISGPVDGFDVVELRDGRLAVATFDSLQAANAGTHPETSFAVASQEVQNGKWVVSASSPGRLFTPPPSIAITKFEADRGATASTAVPQGGTSTLNWTFAPKNGCTPAELVLTKKDYGEPEVQLIHNPSPSASGSLDVVASPAISSPIHFRLSVGCKVAPGSLVSKEATLWFTTATSVTPAPAPVASGPFISPDPAQFKSQFTVEWQVGNAGGGEIPESKVQLFIDDQKEGEAKDVPKLGAGATKTLSWTVTKELSASLSHKLEIRNVDTGSSLTFRYFEVR